MVWRAGRVYEQRGESLKQNAHADISEERMPIRLAHSPTPARPPRRGGE